MSETPNTKTSKEQILAETSLETQALVEVVLNHALEAETNFLSLYEVAIRKAQADEAKRKLQEFRGDHERHVEEIVGVLDQLDGAVLAEERAPTPVARAMAARLEETGSDEELFTEFLASEDFSRHLYTWLTTVPAPEPVARLAERGLRDEERHYAWVTRQLEEE